ncbi:MAG: NADH-quinone oxidoreductase subunit NuoF [Deltaproteobacteria bacterium]|nr:NADH-quinone oxidoreductase subunit NuoF [Deltaproteobacteria bacterium]
MVRILTKYWDEKDSHRIDVELRYGGYESAKKALSLEPYEVIEEVKRAKLRGRGGAGFPTGQKWSFIKNDNKPHYLVVNADEGEPGTFKDRYIMERSPHMLIEGMIIASYAIRAEMAFVYIRGEFQKAYERMKLALEEAMDRGLIGDSVLGSKYKLKIVIIRGAGAYICGEETALIESIEGKPGRPRLRPPFPAVSGLYSNPTIVNNVETIALVPSIFEFGAEKFLSFGTPTDGGTKLFCVSGHVKRPGLYELPMGTNLKEIIFEHAGGIISDGRLKAVLPGGSSTPIISAEECDVNMDFDCMKGVGSMLGSGAIIVMDDRTCMVKALKSLLEFYAEESCGQCTPCREGCPWIYKITKRIENGTAEFKDIDLLLDVAENIMGNTICPLGDAAALPTISIVNKFRDEFEEHIRRKGCYFDNLPLAPVLEGRSMV